ncbi:ABC transporter substrate-binding protein [Mammaliicoccus stepanovicii]|uniref:Iron compound ABC transporter substrate-binding protein n=1 Tax=Mammaliicoccus stepanovicii TaxID=643214 RepID=A0A239Y934_9STAP|nr:iron-siderophore ABC transporter substrate-binding protein [Mammaliicoccus stepanovicii]PNZ77223.1 iron siderophore-binding protein [Mammaliicoccus stepanovicii]GGI43243.1 iron siderophore-binding protein [Mammaliicoccus stepanovicii]SNV54688.1 iron compound ABC transporter substrate-binding protein [Mammaliicoccus stepanovicii]
MKKILSALLVMVVLLAACGNNKNEEASNKDTREIKHAMGTTKVPKHPKRIVVLTNEGTEALVAMGVKPVGAANSYEGNPWYKHLSKQYKGIEPVGAESEINLEKIAKLKPDLIIGNKFRQEAQYKKLSEIAPTVYSKELRGDWKNNFKLYAKAINKEEKGKEVIANYDKHVAKTKKELGDKVNSEVSMVRFMPGDVRIYHKDTFSGVVLDELGIKRPKGQDKDDFAEKGVTKERIKAMDGDYLFYFTFENGDKKVTELEKEWVNDPAFKELNASKKGHVFKVDDAVWNTSGGVLSANMMVDDLKEKLSEK